MAKSTYAHAREVTRAVNRIRGRRIGMHDVDDLTQELSIEAERAAARADGRPGEAYIRVALRNAVKDLKAAAYAACRQPHDRYGQAVAFANPDVLAWEAGPDPDPERALLIRERTNGLLSLLSARDQSLVVLAITGERELSKSDLARIRYAAMSGAPNKQEDLIMANTKYDIPLPTGDVSPCHTNGIAPEGYDPAEGVCHDCVDKFTCLPAAVARPAVWTSRGASPATIESDVEVAGVLAKRMTYDVAIDRMTRRNALSMEGKEIPPELRTAPLTPLPVDVPHALDPDVDLDAVSDTDEPVEAVEAPKAKPAKAKPVKAPKAKAVKAASATPEPSAADESPTIALTTIGSLAELSVLAVAMKTTKSAKAKPAKAPKAKAKPVKAPKAKPVKAPKAKPVKAPKAKPVKAPKAKPAKAKPVKAPKAKPVKAPKPAKPVKAPKPAKPVKAPQERGVRNGVASFLNGKRLPGPITLTLEAMVASMERIRLGVPIDLEIGHQIVRKARGGVEHVVKLTKNGYAYNGEVYGSLSAVAQNASGTPCRSGNDWFGIAKSDATCVRNAAGKVIARRGLAA